MIELVKELNETNLNQQIHKLQNENKELKKSLNFYSNDFNLNKGKQIGPTFKIIIRTN